MKSVMIRKLALLTAVLASLPVAAMAQSVNISIANNGSTATVLNALAKLTGAPSTATVAATTDQASNVVEGVVVAGAGTTGSAFIARTGQVSCIFDAATTAGDWVGVSTTTGGDCKDLGATWPTSTLQVVGRVLTTNGSGGTYVMDVLTGLLAGGGVSLSGNNAFTGSNSFAQLYTPPVTLTDASTVSVNAALSDTFNLLMTSGVGATRALGNPSSMVAGQTYIFNVTQDATGGRLLTFGTDYNGGIALNSAANAKTVFSCYADTSSTLQCAGGAATFSTFQAVTNALTIATSTFTPVLTSGINQSMTLVHGSCPCTIANPTGIASAVGQTGMLDVVQSSTGSDTIGTWGSQYITPGGTSTLTLSTSANAIDHIAYRVIDSTHVLLGAVQLNATH